ncbi:MAG: response regulator [Deltaproteobacteria bacterium]|nr:response regulator [Deltaproteobacteria bacterium]
MVRRILVVDDEQVFAAAVGEYLNRCGYSTVVNYSGEQALQTIEEESPDLVVLDYCLPRMDGLQVLRRIKEGHPKIVVIMMTAYGTGEGEVEAMKLGAFDFIHKPVDVHALRLVTEKAVGTL